ncbi:rhamnogalacturonan acetylesterase [Prevotella sp. PINT]|jgi:Lysophospholipase L1 and related esterases|uniref:rhamnogalacturonan acetylesterase n=1 Tax=Palleniella intestinalis TaxID=2736291 RepID=UPI00155638F1|nr:rhamnogalacturonan acetylesterase [Palleniella intestinalis]NPD81040.1 rhamnogalacturonan acetylesterase [Palleniella intestinalis]
MRKIKFICSILFAVCLIVLVSSSKRQTTVFIIGDSTAAEKDISKGSPERGWGMMLQGCFSEDIVVDNHARNGRSSRSFRDEGLWQKVMDKIKPGDYVFIQFGHNDEKHDIPGKSKRFAKPGTSFDANLEHYVRETREKGGIPVLFNCVERRLFFDARLKKNDAEKTAELSAAEKKGAADDEALRDVKYSEEEVNTEYLVATHYTEDGDYTAAPYLVAKRLNVPFVDANRITHWIETEYGVEGSRKLHMWLKPGEVASIPKGRKDNTHYNIYGARVVANRLADAIGEAVPALKEHVRHYDYVVSKEGRGNFFTIEEAVKAIPAGKQATVLVLDGTFKKPQAVKGVKYEIRPKAVIKKIR